MKIQSRQSKPDPGNSSANSGNSKKMIFLLVFATIIGASIWGIAFSCLDANAYQLFEEGLSAKQSGNTALAATKFAAAEKSMRAAIDAHKKQRGDLDPEIANDMNNLARVMAEESKTGESEEMFKNAIALYDKFGNAAPMDDRVGCLSYYGDFLCAQNRHQEAEPVYDKALIILQSNNGSPTYRAWTLQRLVNVYRHTNRQDRARQADEEARRLLHQ